MDKIFRVLSTKNEKEENQFTILKKYNFEPIWVYVHITEYLVLGKDLLARLYLKVTRYIYNLQKITYLKQNNFVWNFSFLRIPLALKT